MYAKENTCCFTGHRRLPARRLAQIQERLWDQLLCHADRGIVNFLCGGAIGFDTLAGEAVLALRQTRPEVKLIMVLPCRGQDSAWTPENSDRLHRLIVSADRVCCLSESYVPDCMRIRNQYLVNHACSCIAYLERMSGGTFYTVSLALKSGLPVSNLAMP